MNRKQKEKSKQDQLCFY